MRGDRGCSGLCKSGDSGRRSLKEDWGLKEKGKLCPCHLEKRKPGITGGKGKEKSSKVSIVGWVGGGFLGN